MKYALSIFIYLVFAQHLYAEETDNAIAFKSGLNIGFRTLSFEQDFNQGPLTIGGFSTSPAKRTADFTQSFRSIDFSATASYSRFYITATYETNIDTETGSVDTSYVDATTNLKGNSSFDFSRDDYALNIGWNAFDNFSVFTGFKVGETNTTRTTTFGTLGGPDGKVDSSFNESGPFIGLSNSWVFEAGVLTFSAAYAYMHGEFEESGDEVIFARALPSVPPAVHYGAVVQHALEYEGHTDGLSANISWNVLAGEHIAYYYGARWQKYEFDANTDLIWDSYDLTAPDATTPPTAVVARFSGSGDVSNNETITSFYAGINYLF